MKTVPTSFGAFSLDRSTSTLLSSGKAVAIGQRAYALLEALAAADGPVPKATLMEAAWPGTAVEEGNLTVQIAALRKALGPRPDGQEWIVTVPRFGYRLLRGNSLPAGGGQDVSSPLPSLAVLPFLNLSGDPAQDSFADSVVEDIITALSRFKSFAVISRNSSFAYKGRSADIREVARDLGVRYVLEGSVRKAAKQLRVAAQLVDGENGNNIWAENFDGALDDVFEVQDRITARVAGIVHPKVRSAEIERAQRKRADESTAYDLFLQALPKQRLRGMSANDEVYALLLKAVELDPYFAPALVELAFTLTLRVTMGWLPFTHDDAAHAVDFARRAIHHAGGDANVLGTASTVLLLSGKHYDEAMQVATIALETNPSDRVALNCAAVVNLHAGDVRRSLALSHRALELGPNDPGAHWILTAIAHAHMALGQFAEAVHWAERSHVMNAEYDPTLWILIAVNAQLGRMVEARKWLTSFLAGHPGMTVSRILFAQPNRHPERMASILEGLRLAGLPE
jgi:TolB-like protein/DNA-binding winged helix-turn-helix (wHTH) protein/Flp pilus assembly protein TadD